MSRHDLDGVFWTDIAREARSKTEAVRARPAIIGSWRPPTELPDLSAAAVIALDCETYDPNLTTMGPGPRRDGHIVGIAVGVEDGGRWYFPMRHTVEGHLNLDSQNVLRWARDNLCRPNQPKVGANLLYDLDFLAAEGVNVKGPFYDVQVAEPLIDENARSYSLSSLAQKYLGESKVEDALYAWSHAAYGGNTGRSQAANIYRCPPQLVGPYAESDVDLPLRILRKQREIMVQEDLMQVWDVESRLIPLLVAMRQRGVRVDVDAAARLDVDLTQRIKDAERSMGGINVYSADDLVRYCKRNGISYGKTAGGRPSFDRLFLERHTDPVLRQVSQVRKWHKFRDTFVRGYVLDMNTKGRLHCQFNQLRSDESGTVSGRFSSSSPNLQNIPNRDPELGPLVRALFLPDPGQKWVRYDWSQIEYRFLTHYAQGRGADTARTMYRNDPTTDFHQMTSELTGVDRKQAKNINFGLVYGMGEPLLAASLGRSLADVKPLFEAYHSRMPFVKETYNMVSQRASSRGWIRTLLGRRRRFSSWESGDYKKRDERPADSRQEALDRWGTGVRRASTHKALNALLQGSAADAMKKAMVDLWDSGICDDWGAMLLTVHDETDWSVPEDKLHLIPEVRRILQECVSLRVPVVADLEVGENWGALHEQE